MAHALRMTHGIFDGHRRALRDAQQRELLEPGGVRDAFEIRDLLVERELFVGPVGQPAAADVVAIQAVFAGEQREPVTPHRARPVELEVVQPVRGLEQRRPRARHRVGELDAVVRGDEANASDPWREHAGIRREREGGAQKGI